MRASSRLSLSSPCPPIVSHGSAKPFCEGARKRGEFCRPVLMNSAPTVLAGRSCMATGRGLSAEGLCRSISGMASSRHIPLAIGRSDRPPGKCNGGADGCSGGGRIVLRQALTPLVYESRGSSKVVHFWRMGGRPRSVRELTRDVKRWSGCRLRMPSSVSRAAMSARSWNRSDRSRCRGERSWGPLIVYQSPRESK